MSGASFARVASQVILVNGVSEDHTNVFDSYEERGCDWRDTLMIPFYCALLSAILHLVSLLRGRFLKGAPLKRSGFNHTGESRASPAPPQRYESYLARRLEAVGGTSILVYRFVQLLCVLSLLTLSTYGLWHDASAGAVSSDIVIEGVQSVVYLYLSVLSCLALLANPPYEHRAYIHASLILTVSWAVYLYRDVWPLATAGQSPFDLSEGKILWAKIALLSLSGVMVPLFTPRKPSLQQGQEEPAPEETASMFSLLMYGYLEPIIWKAWRIPRLTYDMLPQLAHFNRVEYLATQSSPHLDPLQRKTRAHFAFGLIRVFWLQLCNLAVLDVLLVLAAFAAPVSVNQLLVYLEKGEAGVSIRPWFWIALFFFGSVLRDILVQWFIFNHTRINIRVQAIVTNLVFEHALRIRMKAGSSTAEGPPTADAEEPGSRSTAAREGTAGAGTDHKDGSHLVGKINNLVSGDMRTLDEMSLYIVFFVVEWPIYVVLCTIFQYQVLGWSGLVGIVITILTLPLPGYLAKSVKGVQEEKMKRTDSRVQAVTEMMNVIRMIKLFGWEPRTAAQLDAKREAELVSVRKTKFLTSCINLFNYALPYFVMLSTFFTYTVIMKQELTASAVYSSMTVFDMFRREMQSLFYILPIFMQGVVSLNRISDFLWNTELIDRYVDAERTSVGVSTESLSHDRVDVIGIRRASFTWSRDGAPSPTPGGTHIRAFVLNVDDEVIFQRGKVNLIVGPTGAGKTSLLMALLGEMHYLPSGPDSFVSLPRDGGVAYAAQESWVQNDTIRNNIVFGSAYDEIRYNKVLEQCALTRDLSLFEAGDLTEVGEKGITLSGGQKARVTLARAVYSRADILLLDDVFAALDVHTSKWIVEKCLKGELLRGRTVILITHNVALVGSVVDFVVDMGPDGRILSQGTLDSALARDSGLRQEVTEEQKVLADVEQKSEGDKSEDGQVKQAVGQLIVAEEMEDGHIGWSALKLYFENTSRRPALFWFIYVGSNVVHGLLMNYQAWYLGFWASQYENHPASDVPLQHYLTRYALLTVAGMSVVVFFVMWFLHGSIRASKIIHRKLIRAVLGTTLRWLDRTPTARIITRCTEDIQTVDDGFSASTQMLVDRTVPMILRVLAVVLFSPIFVIPALVVSGLGGLLGSVYIKAQLSTKREMSNSKAPVLGHFSAAISGITSIRAYGAQEAFRKELYARIDRYSRVAVMNENFNRWISARMDFIGDVFTTSLAIYLVYASRLSASNTGFSLNMAAAFSAVIFAVIRTFNVFELNGNSLERIQQYLQIEQEPKPSPEGVPPAYWPSSGKLVVQNLSARYSPDGPDVLHDISFEVASGERVGIVGRTGSGKSSLTLALLRCILTEGEVLYDGLPTSKINLDALRSNITIIPQVPELLSGTLRQNLDPFSEHDDVVLNDALRSAGLFSLQEEGDRSRITLDTEISGGGGNLSVGQRQVLALARAIVRRSKLLILDEATSAIDYKTDVIIQKSLRTEFGRDATVLTVAHRLQTIMDADKIMVLDAGCLVEFGRPRELLEKEEGLFRALVEESGERETLYAVAMGASSSA
ncbi:P-loop containing nucleoside triphosphate hydrolase protein [Trametes polyzona]|nr:P-loop containing nucleoside triphosphate hydrolase protein [Trametes polyzona]